MRLLKKLLKILLLLFLLLTFFFFGYYLSVTKDIVLIPEKLTLYENSVTLFDQDGKEISSVAYSKDTETFENFTAHTKNAFVAVEDKRFYSHHGFDYKRILKAILQNAKSRSFKEGASTISQQLIKNTHLSQQKTIKRKLQEVKLTYRLEKEYSKNEILEKYLNTIYFGHSCFGIVSASNYYFDKKPNELSLSESAILAGLVKSPNNYSPFKNAEKCLKRRNLVLSIMEKDGFITEQEKEQALNEPLPIESNSTPKNQSYAVAVFDELERIADENNFKIGGKINVYTYLQSNLQNTLESLTKEIDCDATISVLNNVEQGVKAYYSSVKNIRRQPASVIKPLLVYAPALEENLLAPVTPILDEKIDFSGYSPKNHDGKYRGYVSARECISKSLNIPAVKTLNALGIEKAINYANQMNLSIDKEDHSLALALGGMSRGFTLNELVGAYSTFANKGEFEQPCFIRKITIDNANVYERNRTKEKVFSETTSYLLTDTLKTCAKEGTAKKLSALPFDVAGKTGTNGTEKGNLDAYALSYTLFDTVGVWLGNDDNAPIPYSGGSLPCNLSFDIHQYLKNDYEKKNLSIPNFEKPSNIEKIAIDKIEYEKNKTLALADDIAPEEYKIYELFKKDAIPIKKANHFSKPSIPTPTIQVNNHVSTITFDVKTPSFYRIKIEKNYYASHNSYASHSTVYDGVVKQTVIDEMDDKHSYVYVITPYYKENKGVSIYLPVISGNCTIPINPTIPPDISSKDWWNY